MGFSLVEPKGNIQVKINMSYQVVVGLLKQAWIYYS